MRKVLMTLVLGMVVLCAAVTTQVGLLVVPADAATPVRPAAANAHATDVAGAGAVYLVTRAADMRFVDSAEAICQRQFAAAGSGCRGLVRGWIMRESRVLAELPYSEALWRMARGKGGAPL